ncbi:MAG: hypothetical protein QM773_02700 [Hyphomonadaceae bacterium]
MQLNQTVSGNHSQEARGFQFDENFRSALVVLLGSAGIIGIAFGAMMMLTSPDGWVMKAANQAMMTAQQGTLASYTIADAH